MKKERKYAAEKHEARERKVPSNKIKRATSRGSHRIKQQQQMKKVLKKKQKQNRKMIGCSTATGSWNGGATYEGEEYERKESTGAATHKHSN
jgi:hypothetical protein